MPINFSISSEDLLRSKVVKPGVYTLKIKDVTEGPGKADPSSITIRVSLVIESDDPAYNGIPIDHYMSEKAAGLQREFIEAVTGKSIEQAITIDLSHAVGRTVKGHIINDKFGGRLVNKIDGWMPA